MKKTVYLIEYFDVSLGDPVLPLAALYLGSYLNKRGYEIKIEQITSIDQMQDILLKMKVDEPFIVGIGARFGVYTSIYTEIAKKIKTVNINIPVVIGGAHATVIFGDLIKESYVDYVIRFDGEIALYELCESISGNLSFDQVRNLAYKENGKVKVNKSAVTDKDIDMFELNFELIDDYKNYVTRSDTDLIFNHYQTSRGCPHNCSFCSEPFLHTKKIRFHSVERVISDIKNLRQKVEFNSIYFVDDQFFADDKRARTIISELTKIGIKVHGLDLRMENITEENVKFLLLNKCNTIFVGVDSENDRILKLMNKGITRQLLNEKFEILRKYRDLRVEGNIILGVPTQTEEEILDSIKFGIYIQKRVPNLFLAFSNYTPYPGTALFDKTLEAGMQYESGLFSSYFTTMGSIKDGSFYNWLNVSDKMRNNLVTVFKISSIYARAKQKSSESIFRKIVFYPVVLLEEFRLEHLFNYGWKFDQKYYNFLKALYRFFRNISTPNFK